MSDACTSVGIYNTIASYLHAHYGMGTCLYVYAVLATHTEPLTTCISIITQKFVQEELTSVDLPVVGNLSPSIKHMNQLEYSVQQNNSTCRL